jgi:threonine dehydratase
MIPPHRLCLERVKLAAQSIDPVFLYTPQFESASLGNELGLRLVLKIETLNPIGSFKGRGADFLVSEAREGTEFICASAGNFGQAMAWACRKRGLKLTVYASKTGNSLKIDRMRMMGAKVILHGQDFDEAKDAARTAARDCGGRFVEDSFDIETLEGAGTMALELLKFPGAFDAVVIAVGNGAMFSSVARVMKARSSGTRMFAVQAVGAPAMIESWRSGHIIVHERSNTIADGIAVRVPIPQALEDMRGLVNDAFLVRDETIVRAMRLLFHHVGVVAEPSGAVGLAALLEKADIFRDQLVCAIVSGCNLTLEQKSRWFCGG